MDLAMASVGMAFEGMACIVMAYIVMAYTVMAHIVMAFFSHGLLDLAFEPGGLHAEQTCAAASTSTRII